MKRTARSSELLKKFLFFSSVCVLLVSAGCSKSKEDEDPSVNIYCSGFDNGHFVYWKNKTENKFTTVQGYSGRTKGIAFVGNDLYIIDDSSVFAKCWKNGVNINLNDGRSSSGAHSIAVEGTDVYVGGHDPASPTSSAVYWKNGVEVILPRGEAVEGIAVSGGKVYATGYNGDTAVVWANGVRSILPTTGLSRTRALAVFQTMRRMYIMPTRLQLD